MMWTSPKIDLLMDFVRFFVVIVFSLGFFEVFVKAGFIHTN